MRITPEQNRRLHQLLAQTGLMDEKPALVRKYSANEAVSSKDLSVDEANALITHLANSTARAASTTRPAQHELRRMRGKVIHYLCVMGYVDDNNNADFERINNFIKNIGSRNPRKVILNFLYKKELMGVLNQVEAMYRKVVTSSE